MAQRDWTHVEQQVLEQLYMDVPDDEEEDVWRDAERERITLEKYVTLAKGRKRGVWDWVSEKEYVGTPKAPVVSQLYRYYFRRYPPTEAVADLVRGYEAFGITAVSKAMKEWAEKFYSPSGIIAMLNRAKRIAEQEKRGEIPAIAQVDEIYL